MESTTTKGSSERHGPVRQGRPERKEVEFQHLLERMQKTMFDCKREPIEQ